jgi:hypothetical protein
VGNPDHKPSPWLSGGVLSVYFIRPTPRTSVKKKKTGARSQKPEFGGGFAAALSPSDFLLLRRQHRQNLVDVEKTGARSQRVRAAALSLTPAAPEGHFVRAESRTSIES